MYKPLLKIRQVSEEEIIENYKKIKTDIRELIADEFAKWTPAGNGVTKPKQAKSRKHQTEPEKKSLSL